MRKFNVCFTVDVSIGLEDEVIDRVDDEWRSQLYDLNTPEEIAEHIAYNLVWNRWKLSGLDGWADMNDEKAVILEKDCNSFSSEEVYE